MPSVPQECQALAADVGALEIADANLRARLMTLVGADAWSAMAQLGQTRQQLTQKRADLDACVRDHSSALQANLVIMDLAPTGGPQPTRVAHLWEIAATGVAHRASSSVSANSFSFTGPLPSQLAISIVTTGAADVVGPDFRSTPIDAAKVTGQGPIRVEVVLWPEVSIEAAGLSQLVASTFTPVRQHFDLGILTADVSVLTADATLAGNGIAVRATGQIDRVAFSLTATLSPIPSAAPGSVDVFDLITVTDPVLDVAGGLPQGLSWLLSTVRPFISNLLTDQLRQGIRNQLHTVIAQALMLPALPQEVTLSVRRFQLSPTAITLQPALGAIGTALSTFRAPAIPPA